ncbi:MAG: hypothetical protein NXY57DRAFT_959453 [Lentinula lateritia]|uniref:Uncharacterized protein n=1 Tax=Lentinula lateritia TaxID=40482 RepID=A0ABQ8VPT2_9AGAR|nr:MAG: hypothetical protein NXY57DRAFT_959453 [Lentinula lateritia]KAJ4498301.1 hypothetical protein C8R41DRAFT_978979 [Lentinula lateritia]
MSSRQSAYVVLASSTYPFPGPPSEPIPPLPCRSYTDPVKTKPLPAVHPLSSVSSPDLMHRNPPLDPRKARRHCANFGFKREALVTQAHKSLSPSIPLPSPDDFTSPGPTPPGTFTSTESDVSSFSDLPLDFPQPPPISPVLRRMKSSPLFTLADTGSAPDLSDIARKRWGAVQGFTDTQAESRKIRNKTDSLTDLEADLDFTPPFEQSSDSYRGRIDGLAKELQSVIRPGTLEPPLPPWIARRDSDTCQESPFLLPAASKSSLLLGNKTSSRSVYHQPTQKQSGPSPALYSFPSSSMKNVSTSSERLPQLVLPRRISKMRSLKFAPECNPSSDRLDISNHDSKPHKPLFRGRSISMDFNNNNSRSRPLSMFAGSQGMSASTSYLSKMGRTPPTRPLVKDNPDHPLNRSRDVGLSTPFLHRPVNSDTPVRHQRRLHHSMMPSPGLKSFMDITPEQVQRKPTAHKDKVRKLLSRASQVFDWRKKKGE